MKKALTFLVSVAASVCTHGQLVTFGNGVPVVEGSDTLLAAWTGGINVPQFCHMDLDNDGIMDLLAYDRQDDKLIPLRYKSAMRYEFAPEFISRFPTSLLSDWIFTADYDGDGWLDLFSGSQTSNVRVFRNTSSGVGGTLAFTQYKFPITTDYYPPGGSLTGLYAARNDYSAIIDVDGDTDLDFLVFDGAGSFLQWHRNTSMENGWGRDSLQFVEQSKCFGHFQEDVSGCTATLDNPPCVTGVTAGNGGPGMQAAVHAGSTLLAWNLNGDSLVDIIVGDASCDHLYALTNGGSRDTAHFTSIEINFPVLDTPVVIYNFPAAFAVDINQDGARDMVAAPNVLSTGEDIDNAWYYLNVGLDDDPDLRFQGKDFAQRDMIETGTGSLPALIDFDQDGDKDLIIGNFGRFLAAGTSESRLSLYLNEGTDTDPRFVLHSRNWLDLAGQGLEGIAPCAGDLDGDGDEDLLLGTFDGTLMHYRNNALPGDTARMTLTSSNFQSLDAGLYSAPHLYDLDDDSDLDLLMGNHRGFIQYYRNTGSASLPLFSLVTDSLGHIKMNDASGFPFTNGYARPWIAQLDADPQPELLVGGYTGEVHAFDNATDASGAAFASLGKLGGDLDVGLYSAPLAGYKDALGQLRFLIGNYRGGLMLAEGGFPISVEEASSTLTFGLAPNPTSDLLRVTVAEPAVATLTDVNGRHLLVRPLTQGENELQLASLATGIYLLTLRSHNALATQRVAVVR